MEKWKCNICGYIYDPEKGDPDGDISPNTPLKNSLTIGSALCAVLPKICLKKFSEFLNPGI